MGEHSDKSMHDKKDSEALVSEVAIVYSKPKTEHDEGKLASFFKDKPQCAIQRFSEELKNRGLVLEDVEGINSEHFLKVAAPLEVLGRTAETLHIKKPTRIGLDAPFEWDEKDAFVLQPEDDHLFSWTERHKCLQSLLKGVVNSTNKDVVLRFPGETKELIWKPEESLLTKLISTKVVKDVLILHEENKRKELLHNWALRWLDFTSQPIDSIYAYFGPKVAIYFSFLGMYTYWLLFPSVIGIFFYFVHLGTWEPIVPPLFSMLSVTWAVLFLQFWKRKNAALLARWNQSLSESEYGTELSWSSNDAVAQSTLGVSKVQKQAFQKEEWAQHFRKFGNNAVAVGGILLLQLPFEIAYAHFSYVIKSRILNFLITGIYVLMIQNFTKIGGKFAVKLAKSERYANKEAKADSLIYKVFGVYFMQSYIGLFYHAMFQRDFSMLRQFLVQRLVLSQILNNFTENLMPFLLYCRNRHNTLQAEKDAKKDGEEKSKQHMVKIEKEYLRPKYAASIENDLEDGLFDDFLELALQFGMVTMFASAFPLVFAFALLNNLIEIRSDALKLLVMLRRPVPRAAYSIGAWLNIFQYLGVIAICTNCALLVCLYDQQGAWNIEPGLAAILFMEHALLLVKFGFACFVPEEPAWVRARKLNSRVIRERYAKSIFHQIGSSQSQS